MQHFGKYLKLKGKFFYHIINDNYVIQQPWTQTSDGNSQTAICSQGEDVITPGVLGIPFCLPCFPPEQAASPHFPLLTVSPAAQGLFVVPGWRCSRAEATEVVGEEPTPGQIQVKLDYKTGQAEPDCFTGISPPAATEIEQLEEHRLEFSPAFPQLLGTALLCGLRSLHRPSSVHLHPTSTPRWGCTVKSLFPACIAFYWMFVRFGLRSYTASKAVIIFACITIYWIDVTFQ